MAEVLLVVKAITELMPVITGIVKLFKDAKKNRWIKDGLQLQSKIQNAKTDEERMALAQSLFEHRAS